MFRKLAAILITAAIITGASASAASAAEWGLPFVANNNSFPVAADAFWYDSNRTAHRFCYYTTSSGQIHYDTVAAHSTCSAAGGARWTTATLVYAASPSSQQTIGVPICAALYGNPFRESCGTGGAFAGWF